MDGIAAYGSLRPFELGFPRTALRRTLVAAVLRGEYRPHTEDALPEVAERLLLLGYEDEPLGIVETTDVRIVPAGEVDLAFARDEGEGFTSVAAWRAAHERFWAARGFAITDDTLVVCERFRLVERLQAEVET
jgi:uncharacterized protein YhfF